jgi:hypothetical protein
MSDCPKIFRGKTKAKRLTKIGRIILDLRYNFGFTVGNTDVSLHIYQWCNEDFITLLSYCILYEKPETPLIEFAILA